ncbi:MAG: beta-ketoacyl-[acyl-carrier-protein] synthase family protein [Acidobacteria bacterium]|nr:beta-ketoacyl-[acyl-carrier-protein] synthase family protein [Acidobacteriota bacterium]
MGAQRRVVVTGMGAVSSIGTGLPAIEASLRAGRSGIRSIPEWAAIGFGSQVAGVPEAEPDSPLLTRKVEKSATSMSRMALYATYEALAGAGLDPAAIRGSRIAVVIGSGIGSAIRNYNALKLIEQEAERARAAGVAKFQSTRRVSPFTVPQVMTSTAAANVTVALGTRGESWCVSSACSTGSHAIALAALLIRSGRYERILAGAADELDWTRAGAFDAMHALSRAFNETPERASRPFDAARDGFVISGGSGILLLEDLEAAQRRGAPILAELVGFAANSDGHDMVAPLTEGAIEVMREALEDAGLRPEEIDYVNAHGTSTPAGDPSEATAMQAVFGPRQPWISSTKSTTGHAVGAAGSLEAIYTVLMLRGGFLAPSVNLEDVDDRCSHLRLVRERDNALEARTALSNSFGFGGTNACLALRRFEG